MPTVPATIPLQVLASDGRATLYAQARIYTTLGSLVDTVDLPYLADGLYGSSYVFTSVGFYSVVYEFYENPSHTIVSTYDKTVESFELTTPISSQLLDESVNSHIVPGSVGEAIAIVRGRNKYFVIDRQVYNSKGLLITARCRIYKTAAEVLDPDGHTPLAFVNIVDLPQLYPDDDLSSVYTEQGLT
jgi:hypothetical protein